LSIRRNRNLCHRDQSRRAIYPNPRSATTTAISTIPASSTSMSMRMATRNPLCDRCTGWGAIGFRAGVDMLLGPRKRCGRRGCWDLAQPVGQVGLGGAPPTRLAPRPLPRPGSAARSSARRHDQRPPRKCRPPAPTAAGAAQCRSGFGRTGCRNLPSGTMWWQRGHRTFSSPVSSGAAVPGKSSRPPESHILGSSVSGLPWRLLAGLCLYRVPSILPQKWAKEQLPNYRQFPPLDRPTALLYNPATGPRSRHAPWALRWTKNAIRRAILRAIRW